MKKTFASDNYSGVHPEVVEALIKANIGHASSYGADEYTEQAVKLFKNIFDDETEIFFVYNGTGANVLGLKGITNSFHSIFCSELAHINVDESTAPESFTGCKVTPIVTVDGKILPEDVEEKIIRLGDQHHPQARVISISQSTEYGTVYSIDEIKALSALAHRHDMLLHMDGSRISNAAVSLNQDFKTFTKDAGVDILSFGGTKNGLMFGEAVIVFDKERAKYFPYIRKQAMQLHSKMRFIGAQFSALLSNDLWKRNASHSNQMARKMEQGLRDIKAVRITKKVEANVIFAILPPAIIPKLQEAFYFYVWNEKTWEVRIMCSFDTTEAEVGEFITRLKELLGNQ